MASTSIDPTIQTAVFAAAETALNRTLALAPNSKMVLGGLVGNIFAIHCSAPEFSTYLRIDEDQISILSHCDEKANTTVSGTVSDFRELMLSQDPTATLINGNLVLKGDSNALIELQKALSQLDIDWEAPLVDKLGDVLGHQVAVAIEHGFKIGKQAYTSLTRQLDEYLHEEARLTPPNLELDDFYRDIAELQQRVERLQSRIARQKKRLPPLSEA